MYLVCLFAISIPNLRKYNKDTYLALPLNGGLTGLEGLVGVKILR
jgi:hypothetical protein